MRLAALKASRAMLRARLAYRRRKHRFYHEHSKRPHKERRRLAAKWHKLEEHADQMVKRRDRQIAAKTPKPRIAAGGGFRGSEGVVKSLVRIGGNNLTVTSAKRVNSNPYSGRGSDHDHRNTDAYANDISNGSAPTPGMDDAAYRIMRALGFKDYRRGQAIDTRRGVRTLRLGGGTYRIQVIYRGSGPAFGGNHLNHIHVGAKRVG